MSHIEDYTMIVQVAGEEGEECISINTVSDTDMQVLDLILMYIRGHRGYQRTGRYRRPGEPTARDLYHHHVAWDVWESIIPRPLSGFSTIISVRLYKEKPLKMNML